MNKLPEWKWEQTTFPKQYKIEIKPAFRIRLIKKLGAMFGVHRIEVSLNCSDGRGWCRKTFWGQQVSLPRETAKCSLAVIIHELAHAYSNTNESEAVHHDKRFRRNLIKIMVESWKMLPGIFREIRNEQAAATEAMNAKATSEIRKAERKAQINQERKGYPYRIAKVQERIKRLERKKKSIETRLKSARRSLSVLQRLEVSKLKGFEESNKKGEVQSC